MSEQDSSHAEIAMARAVTRRGSNQRFSSASNPFLLHIGTASNIRADRAHPHPGIVKLLPAIQADLVSPLLDRKYTTLLPVMTSEHETENSQQRFHKSSALCRRSQLPFASSQASSARTLARASAIEQSAAP